MRELLSVIAFSSSSWKQPVISKIFPAQSGLSRRSRTTTATSAFMTMPMGVLRFAMPGGLSVPVIDRQMPIWRWALFIGSRIGRMRHSKRR